MQQTNKLQHGIKIRVLFLLSLETRKQAKTCKYRQRASNLLDCSFSLAHSFFILAIYSPPQSSIPTSLCNSEICLFFSLISVFRSFNPVKSLQDFESGAYPSSNPSTPTTNSRNSSSSIESFDSSVSHPPNNTVAVVMNVFKRNYFDHVFSSLCSQSLFPSYIILVQNEAHLINLRSLIPPLCRYTNITFFHIWNTNWNPYSFFRHFVPIPSDIQYTVITDDDLFLQPNALEMGIKFVETYHCVATEHGGKITNNTEGFDTWEDIRSDSSDHTLIRYADYASLPQFSKTSWRKKVMKTPPFYRRFGDILFASISLFQETSIPPCIPPNFTFCEASKDDDSFSTLKKNRGLYADDYNRIASTWIKMGYIPLYQREHEYQREHQRERE